MACFEINPIPDDGGGGGCGVVLLLGLLLFGAIGSCNDTISGKRGNIQISEPLPKREEMSRPVGKQDTTSQYPSAAPPRQEYQSSVSPRPQYQQSAPPEYSDVPPLPPGYTIQTCARCGRKCCLPPLLPPTGGRTATWSCQRCGYTTRVY